MALNPTLLTTQMLAVWPYPPVLTSKPNILDEFGSYAEGVIQGVQAATVTGMTVGLQGTPGAGSATAIINPGPIVLASMIQINCIGILPPAGGMIMPAQFPYFFALGQIASHLALAQIDFSIPTDAVATGSVIVSPGQIQLEPNLTREAIIAASLSKGFTMNPLRFGMANAVALTMQQFLLLGSSTGAIIGGVPIPPPAGPIPTAGQRVGVIS